MPAPLPAHRRRQTRQPAAATREGMPRHCRWPRLTIIRIMTAVRHLAALILVAGLAAVVRSDAQGRNAQSDSAYDGRFTFVRLRWQSDFGGFRRGGFSAAWNHDYP